MFLKTTTFSFLLLLSVSGTALFFLARQSEEENFNYQKIFEESRELRSKSALERKPARQLRTGVQKDIWTLNNSQRLHYRIKSSESDLIIGQTKGKIDVTEQLKSIECCMQEEIEENVEQIRYLFAPKGKYFFPSHEFLAEEVDLYFFSLPGKELPSSWPKEAPFLSGTASEVVFSAQDGLPSFTATHLNAEFDAQQ